MKVIYVATLGVVMSSMLAATTAVLIAGPLNPPAGPVASTYKTLSEVEPRIAINSVNTPGDADSVFKITKPGSYYLTANVVPPVGSMGIELAASGVTIDLSGFQISGLSGGAGVGTSSLTIERIAIRNGQINLVASGISLGDTPGVAVEHVNVESCLGNGIDVGNYSRVAHCISRNNAVAGIVVGVGSTISGCTVAGNNSMGIFATNSVTITDCAASGNDTYGIQTQEGCVIARCTATQNGDRGILAGQGCTVTACAANENGTVGISADAGSTIADCSAFQNTTDGIRGFTRCLITRNNCVGNGAGAGDGAGIHVPNGGSRVEGNLCSMNDRGIDVDLAGSIIIRNICDGNTTDWTIAANNVIGPILDRRAPASAPVNGFSAPSSLGSTDANANYSY